MKTLLTLSLLLAVAMIAGTVSAAPSPAAATDSPAKFYQGKVITINTQSPAGSTSDLWARTLAVYLPEITGAKIAVKNETAGGGRVIENAFATTIKPDGLTMMFTSAGTIWPAFMTGDPAVKFDITKFQYIGGTESSNTLIAVSPKGKIKTIDDLRKAKGLKFAASNKTSLLTYANALAMSILGLDGRIITGFQGSTGRLLAIQQGDADGLVTSPVSAARGMTDGVMLPLVQIGTERTKPCEEFPSMMEIVKADTLNDMQKRLIASIDILSDAKFLFAPPGVPQDRMAFLSGAFKKALENPALRAAMLKATGEDIPPYVSGDALSKMAKQLAARKPEMTIWNDVLNKYVK